MFERVLSQLRLTELPSPSPEDSEVAFTADYLQPAIASLLEDLDIHGLVQTGDGADAVVPISFLGKTFWPDIAIKFHEQMIVACEVKFLRPSHRQNSIATSVGQATLYKHAGYAHAIVVLIDTDPQSAVREDHVSHAEALLQRDSELGLVYRTSGKPKLSEHR